MKKPFLAAMPFSALAVAFVVLGLLLDDPNQVTFGFVWAVIALVAFFWRRARDKSPVK